MVGNFKKKGYKFYSNNKSLVFNQSFESYNSFSALDTEEEPNQKFLENKTLKPTNSYYKNKPKRKSRNKANEGVKLVLGCKESKNTPSSTQNCQPKKVVSNSLNVKCNPSNNVQTIDNVLAVTSNYTKHSSLNGNPSVNNDSTDSLGLPSFKKNNVIIMSDSQGRSLSSYLLNSCSEKYNVIGYVQPGATLSKVIAKVEKVTKGMNKKDFVIVFGGTNDIGYERCNTHLLENIKNLVFKTAHTNLILIGIPFRFGHSHLNSDILNTNRLIYDIAISHDHVIYQSLSSLFKYKLYYDNIHFNKSGKKIIAQTIINIIHLFTSPSKFQYSIPVIVSGRCENAILSPPVSSINKDCYIFDPTQPSALYSKNEHLVDFSEKCLSNRASLPVSNLFTHSSNNDFLDTTSLLKDKT